MKKVKIEICCGSAQDALEALAAGADRVELCSALPLGGLTPSLGQVKLAKAAGCRVMAMVRPREGGFCYSEAEFETMRSDVADFAAAGCDGVVFGVLRPDGTVDEERCRVLVEAAGNLETVFHRAVDVVPDWRGALDALIGLGFTRVLTSGQAPSALEGAETIRDMGEYAAGRIEILPGAGVKGHNARKVLERTGCDQLHLSLKKACRDGSAALRPEIRFGGSLPGDETVYGMADREEIGKLVSELNGPA